MNYQVNLKNLKKSADILQKYLSEKALPISHSIALEAISNLLNFKNWNTAQAHCTDPNKIVDYDIQKKYMFELKANIDLPQLKKMIKKSLQDANCQAVAENYLSKNHHHYFELNCNLNDKNTITFIIVLCNKMIEERISVESFDYCRVSIEKQNFMEYIRSQNKTIPTAPVFTSSSQASDSEMARIRKANCQHANVPFDND